MRLSTSHPSRVRELKLDYLDASTSLLVSHPSRVRELKLREYVTQNGVFMSHPSRVRELKLGGVEPAQTSVRVAPLPGA